MGHVRCQPRNNSQDEKTEWFPQLKMTCADTQGDCHNNDCRGTKTSCVTKSNGPVHCRCWRYGLSQELAARRLEYGRVTTRVVARQCLQLWTKSIDIAKTYAWHAAIYLRPTGIPFLNDSLLIMTFLCMQFLVTNTLDKPLRMRHVSSHITLQ